MRLHCPACATEYEVPDTALAPGRLLRCACCRHEWAPFGIPATPAGGHGEAEALADGAPSAPATPAMPVSGAASAVRAEVLGAWLLSVLLLGAGAAEAVYWHKTIVAAWPPAERVFVLVGLHGPDE